MSNENYSSMKYTCPMHPEVIQDLPGKCPKCGMDLVVAGEKPSSYKDRGLGPITWKSYLPLVAIISLIFIGAFVFSYLNHQGETFLRHLIKYFVAGFFITFSSFKLIDMKGFAAGYSTYDILAKKVFAYGYIYPFIEMFFGITMVLNYDMPWLLLSEIFIMTFSGLGVAIKLSKKEKFQCVCLGTFLRVPLTYVTLVEDFGMALLALVLLIM